MKKLIIIIAIIILAGIMIGCTENARSRSFGGTQHIDLDKGEMLINATWKNDGLWYLTRQRTVSDINQFPSTYILRQKSSLGIVEGTVIFKEK